MSFQTVTSPWLLLTLLLGCGHDRSTGPDPPPAVARVVYISSDANVRMATLDTDTGRLAVIDSLQQYITYMVVDPRGRFLFGCEPFDRLWVFAIAPRTGFLTAVPGAPFRLPCYALLTADPLGRFLYLGSEDGVSVYAYDGTTGAVTPVPGSPFPTESFSRQVVPTPSGRFVYAPMPHASAIAAFAVPDTGVLIPVAGSPFRAAGGAVLATIDTRRDRMYVFSTPAYVDLNGVSLFAVDADTGRLASLPPRLEADEDFAPGPVVLHPDGQFAYVQNSRYGGPPFGVFRIEADGRLARQRQSEGIPPRPGLGGPIIEPAGRFAYLYDVNTRVFYGFRVEAASGALVSIPGAELEVPDSAWQMVFRP